MCDGVDCILRSAEDKQVFQSSEIVTQNIKALLVLLQRASGCGCRRSAGSRCRRWRWSPAARPPPPQGRPQCWACCRYAVGQDVNLAALWYLTASIGFPGGSLMMLWTLLPHFDSCFTPVCLDSLPL